MCNQRDYRTQMPSIALALATLFTLTVSVVAQRSTPTDRQDATLLLQGTSPTPEIDLARIAEIEKWLGRIRNAHPEVAEIHQMMGHSAGLASVILQPEANKRLEELVEWKIVDGGWETGMPALDKIGAELGVRFGHGPVKNMWCIGFAKEYDVIAVCRRYEALAEVKHAFANPFPGDGDEIFLRQSGTKLNFVFKHGWGDCTAGCINNHFHYFEVDSKADKIVKRAELKPPEWPASGIPLWGIPARFLTTPFADFDAVLQAADHKDWWVVLHALEVTGQMLPGVDEPEFRENAAREQFRKVRDGAAKNKEAAYGFLLRGLEHEQHQLRVRALWHFQKISELYHTGDADGIRAWKDWVADGAKVPD